MDMLACDANTDFLPWLPHVIEVNYPISTLVQTLASLRTVIKREFFPKLQCI
jgi:hypothetical protein